DAAQRAQAPVQIEVPPSQTLPVRVRNVHVPQPGTRRPDRAGDGRLLDVRVEEIEGRAHPGRGGRIQVRQGRFHGRDEVRLVAVDGLDGEADAEPLRLAGGRPHALD